MYACNCCKTWPAFEEIERETERRQDVGLGQGLLERNATEVEQKDLRKIYKKLGLGFLYSIERWKEIGRKIWYIEYTQKSYYIRYINRL